MPQEEALNSINRLESDAGTAARLNRRVVG